ncbi:hypothetical protein ACH50O_01425 [Methylomonas sp. 2BW1-5-20]|uniref:hypothetical protein n=1 Tax=Methylomonas sp. 2BW1-5-20 TaxID=3376686 RepID=UPI00404D238B
MVNSHKLDFALRILKAFEVEGLDVSARGFLRVIDSVGTIPLADAVKIMAPRDYDLAVSSIQFNRILETLSRDDGGFARDGGGSW